MYRRHCLWKSSWWQKLHSTNESEADSKNEHNIPKASKWNPRGSPWGRAEPSPATPEKRRGDPGVWLCNSQSMDIGTTWIPPSLPPGSRQHAQEAGRVGYHDSHGRVGCSSQLRVWLLGDDNLIVFEAPLRGRSLVEVTTSTPSQNASASMCTVRERVNYFSL